MIKTLCKSCGKTFYCNGDKECEGSVKYAKLMKEPFSCYCEECLRKENLGESEEEIKKCNYDEKVNFT